MKIKKAIKKVTELAYKINELDGEVLVALTLDAFYLSIAVVDNTEKVIDTYINLDTLRKEQKGEEIEGRASWETTEWERLTDYIEELEILLQNLYYKQAREVCEKLVRKNEDKENANAD